MHREGGGGRRREQFIAASDSISIKLGVPFKPKRTFGNRRIEFGFAFSFEFKLRL